MVEGRAVDVVFLGFSKAFDTVPRKIFIGKLLKHGLDEQTVVWIKNWLISWARSTIGVNTGSSPA